MASRRNNRRNLIGRKTGANTRELEKLAGRHAHDRGRGAERRAVESLSHQRPPWMLDVRLATPEEDAAGIDLVASTDKGPVRVQIKSSHLGRQKALEKHPEIPVVVVASSHRPSQIRGRLIHVVAMERKKL